MVYNPDLSSLNSLETEALYGFVQDEINTKWATTSDTVPSMLNINVSGSGSDCIVATLRWAPILQLLPSQPCDLSVQIHLKLSDGGTLTLNGNSCKPSQLAITITGPLTIEPLSGPDYVIKLGDSSNVTAVTSNPNMPNAFQALMQSYWKALADDAHFDLAYIGWPYTTTPGLYYSQWKTSAMARIDGTTDGVDRLLDSRYSSIVSNGGDQLIVVSTEGSSLPTPKNYVPQDEGAVLMIACKSFINDQLVHTLNALGTAAVPDHDPYQVLISKYTKVAPPAWPNGQWVLPDEPISSHLADLNMTYCQEWPTNVELPDNIPPNIHNTIVLTMSSAKSNTISITGSVVNQNFNPPPTYTVAMDYSVDAVDTNGVLRFHANDAYPDIFPCNYESIPLPQRWMVGYVMLIEKIGYACPGWGTDSGKFEMFAQALPATKYYLMSVPTISAATFDFSVAMSYILGSGDPTS